MQRPFFLASLLPCLAISLFALPVRADMASPQQDIREAKVAQWHQRYPNTKPAMELSLSPDGKTLAVRFSARTPAAFAVRLNGKESAKGAVAGLKGGTATERISLAGHPSRQGEWVVHADFSLQGVQAKGAELRETGESISGCLRRRFEIVEKGGTFRLNELGLDGEDYFILRRCGL